LTGAEPEAYLVVVPHLACVAGGVLMNESITRAAGAAYGQELCAAQMEQLILAAGLSPRVRSTLYENAPEQQAARALSAAGTLP
jgi:FO synthase